jgi:hypothetical protein
MCAPSPDDADAVPTHLGCGYRSEHYVSFVPRAFNPGRISPSAVEAVLFTPKVELSEVTQWQEYAIANAWMVRSEQKLAIASSEGTRSLRLRLVIRYPSYMMRSSMRTGTSLHQMAFPIPPPFYPLWQHSPPPFPMLTKQIFLISLKVYIAREGSPVEILFDPTDLLL